MPDMRQPLLSALPALAGLALLLLLPVPSRAAETDELCPVDLLLGGGPCAERYHRPRAAWSSLPFVENLGQWDLPARFVVRSGRMTAACAEGELLLHGVSSTSERDPEWTLVRLVFEGADPDARIEGQRPVATRYSFFLGNDPQRWQPNVPAYERVRYRGLHPGIDLQVRISAGLLEYDWILAPGADLESVVIEARGIDGLDVNEAGVLVMDTCLGQIRQPPPLAWLERSDGGRQPVACRYRLLGDDRYGFEVPGHDRSLELVIDPVLEYTWSAKVGGSLADAAGWPNGCHVDDDGILTVTGITASLDFPGTDDGPGAFGGMFDAFVMRLDPAAGEAGEILWATYFGGGSDDHGRAIDLDDEGNVIFIGNTESDTEGVDPDPIPLVAAYQADYGGGIPSVTLVLGDAYLAALNSTGDVLLYSTYLGGPSNQQPLKVVASGDIMGDLSDVIVMGSTALVWDIVPAAAEAPYSEDGEFQEGFLFWFNLSEPLPEDQLYYATFLGGAGGDVIFDAELDDEGILVIGGRTTSEELEIDGPEYPGGDFSAYLARIDPEAGDAGLLYYGYVGGDGFDSIRHIHVDDEGMITFVGVTDSEDLFDAFDPEDVYQPEFGGGEFDLIVGRVDPTVDVEDQLLWGTYYGGPGTEGVNGAAFDAAGGVLVTSWASGGMPVTPGAIQERYGGGALDGCLIRIDPSLAGPDQLTYATYLGGGVFDITHNLAVNADGLVVVGGSTVSADYPTTTDAFEGASNDAAITVFQLDLVDGDDEDCNENGIPDKHDLHLTREVQLAPAEAELGDLVGNAVAVHGDLMLVGARSRDDGSTNAGAAYLFRYADGEWLEEATFKIDEDLTAVLDWFGTSVAVSGNVVVVGRPGAEDEFCDGPKCGLVHVFVKDGDEWVPWQQIAASDQDPGAEFGGALDISGERMVVGSNEWDDDDAGVTHAGAIYVLDLDLECGWQQCVTLSVDAAEAGDLMGSSVAMDGDVALGGAPGRDDVDADGADLINSGAAYAWHLEDDEWTERQLIPDALTTGAEFGSAVDLSGDWAVVGAPGDSGGFGAVFVFRFDALAGEWEQVQTLLSDPLDATGARFGESVAIDRNLIAVGAPESADDEGRLYIYEFDEDAGESGEFVQIRKMPGAAADHLGSSVALSAGFVAAGADGLGAPPINPMTGSVYVANIPDCDRNGIPDSCEDLADANDNGLPDLCEVGLEATPSDTCLPLFKRGDVNGDGTVSGLGDGLYLLFWTFLVEDRPPAPPCMDAADADDSGGVSGLADGLFLLFWQFLPEESDVPPAPGPDCCGSDPTADPTPKDPEFDLGCETPPVCN